LLDYSIDRKNDLHHPEDPDAISHNTSSPIIDFRSAFSPGSGLEWSGASRKKEKKIP
jgi:hypothetical protein